MSQCTEPIYFEWMEQKEIIKYEWTRYDFFLRHQPHPHRHAESPHDFHTANIVLSVS